MAGQMGNKRITQVGLTVVEAIPEENLLLVRGAVPGPQERDRRRARGHSLMAAPKAPVLDASGKKAKDVTLDEGVFTAEVKPASDPRGRARRVGRGPKRNRRDEEPRARRRRPREAVAPEGHRPRPRRHDRGPQFTGGGHAFRIVPRSLHAQGEPQGPQGRASLRALPPCWPRIARRARRERVRGAVHEGRGRVPRRLGEGPAAARARPAGRGRRWPRSFRNLPRVLVLAPSELEVGALVWARSVVATESALERIQEVAR